MSTSERILVHGPCLRDLTDFLYFDKIAYPVLIALVRPPGLAPGYVGYKAQELLPQGIHDKLMNRGLMIKPAEVLLVPQPSDLLEQFKKGADAMMDWAQKAGENLGTALFEICTLEGPLNDPNITAWLQDIDEKTKRLSDLMGERNKHAVAKYYEEDVTRVLTPGWDNILSLFLPLPCLSQRPPIETIIDFLTDEQTIKKRAQLFNWHKEIDTEAENKASLVDEITDILVPRLKTYLQWLRASGLVSGVREAEFLIHLGNSLDKCEITSQNELFRIAKRGLSLSPQDQAPGRELAYITYAKRNWRDWYRGVVA